MNTPLKSSLRLTALAVVAVLLAGCVEGYATVRPADSVWVSGYAYDGGYAYWPCAGWPGYGYCGTWPGYVTVYGGPRYRDHHRYEGGGHGWNGGTHHPQPHGAWGARAGYPPRQPSIHPGTGLRRP